MKTILILLSALITLTAHAEKLRMECYVNNLENCQGCGSLNINRDTESGLYEFYTTNASVDPSTEYGKPQYFKNLSIVTYGADPAHSLKISGSTTPLMRKNLEFKGIENTIASLVRVTLKVEPNTGDSGQGEYIGSVHYKIGGITIFTEKAQCYDWEKLEE